MKTQVLKSKHRLLVLMDKSKASNNALKNAISLAKLIDGSIEVFQVKKPTSKVRNENQIAVMRAIGEEYYKQKKEFRDIVNLVAKKEGLPIICNFTYGNVKNEIKEHIEKTKPDIIVVGKRKKKIVNFLGDSITSSLLKYYDGAVLISGNNEALTSYNSKSMGFLNNVEGIEHIALVNDLKEHTKKPLKLFKVNQGTLNAEKVALAKGKEQKTKKETIVFEFDASDNTASGMANVASNNNLSLLCLHKTNNKHSSFSNRINEIFTKTIEQTNIPVLVLNNK